MDYSKLSGSPLFINIPLARIEELLSSSGFRTKTFRKDSLIAQAGDELNSLMIVLGGVAKGEMVDYSGRVIKIEDIPSPGALAAAFIFGSRNRFPVNVIAVSDVELLILGKPEFLKLLMSDDKVLVNFMNMISNRSQFLSDKIKFLNFKTIKGKLAQFILQRTGQERSSLVLDLTQNELADYFGVARPSVARALGDIEDEGIIEAKGKTIRILSREALTALTLE
jgi:CRP/FNR family transcriptional regulator, dissimilatory nitrate respiration regulator